MVARFFVCGISSFEKLQARNKRSKESLRLETMRKIEESGMFEVWSFWKTWKTYGTQADGMCGTCGCFGILPIWIDNEESLYVGKDYADD